MKKKICLITGVNTGMGKQVAEQLANGRYHVIMACRNLEKSTTALQEIKRRNSSLSLELMLVDMGLLQSVRNMASTFDNTYD